VTSTIISCHRSDRGIYILWLAEDFREGREEGCATIHLHGLYLDSEQQQIASSVLHHWPSCFNSARFPIPQPRIASLKCEEAADMMQKLWRVRGIQERMCIVHPLGGNRQGSHCINQLQISSRRSDTLHQARWRYSCRSGLYPARTRLVRSRRSLWSASLISSHLHVECGCLEGPDSSIYKKKEQFGGIRYEKQEMLTFLLVQ
jgi:hypothetical protein